MPKHSAYDLLATRMSIKKELAAERSKQVRINFETRQVADRF